MGLLKLLPDITFPVTSPQINGLMDGVLSLNVLDAGLSPRLQKALDIVLETYELKATSGGKHDYTGRSGNQKLYQDALSFVSEGSGLVTRHGDLRAAHLAINWHNAQKKLEKAGLPLMSAVVNDLVAESIEISNFQPQTEERMGLFLSYLQKK